MNKKPNFWARRLILLIVMVALVAGILFILRGIIGMFLPSTDAGTQIPGSPETAVQPFGNRVLALDGTELNCYDINGNLLWPWSPVDVGSRVVASDENIVIWKDRRITMLSADGNQVFSREAEANIVDVRISSDYLAIQIGNPPDSTIITYNKSFSEVDRIPFASQRILDFGFFGQQANMLWTMALDTSGRLPVTYVATYQPGKDINGYASISEQLIYKVLFNGSAITLVGSENILAIDYATSITDDTKTKLIYGWYMMDSLATESGNIMIFAPSPEPGAPIAIDDLRVFVNGVENKMHLSAPINQLLCSNNYIFGFNGPTVSVYDYNGERVHTASLGFPIDRVIGMVGQNHALVVSGNNRHIIRLR